MIKERHGHRIDAWVHAAFPFLFWRRLHPDALTVTGTLIAGSAGLAFADGRLVLGAGLLAVGGFFDLVDGVVARHFGIATRFGAFLDSSLDRVVDILAILGLVVFYAGAGEPFWALLSSWVLVASVLTSYAKARAELMIPRMPGGFLERGERIGLLILGGLSGWMPLALVVLGIGSTVTVVQRFSYAYREMAALDRAERVAPVEAGAPPDDATRETLQPTGGRSETRVAGAGSGS